MFSMNHFEKWELSTDIKAAKVHKSNSTSLKTQKGPDYGCGIAAQVGVYVQANSPCTSNKANHSKGKRDKTEKNDQKKRKYSCDSLSSESLILKTKMALQNKKKSNLNSGCKVKKITGDKRTKEMILERKKISVNSNNILSPEKQSFVLKWLKSNNFSVDKKTEINQSKEEEKQMVPKIKLNPSSKLTLPSNAKDNNSLVEYKKPVIQPSASQPLNYKKKVVKGSFLEKQKKVEVTVCNEQKKILPYKIPKMESEEAEDNDMVSDDENRVEIAHSSNIQNRNSINLKISNNVGKVDTTVSKSLKKIRPASFVLKITSVSASTQTDITQETLNDFGTENIKPEEILTQKVKKIKIGLKHDQYARKIEKPLSDSKGNDTSDLFKYIVDNFKPKDNNKAGNKSDKGNVFITLNSRFQVMHNMDMKLLELIPEDDGGEKTEEPVRIFNIIRRENYKNYLNVSYVEGIPDLIMTRLYAVKP